MGESAAVAGLVAEKRKLKKSLFRFDMIFFTVCAIVALDTIGQSSSYGAQAVFWLIVSALTFLIPYGLITAELGAAFPTEGATYDWVRLAYGHFAGAVVSVLYWLSNPIWLGGFFPTDFVVIIGVVGVIVFQWIGFELQTNASEEMENPQRDIPRAVYASGLISFLSYAIPILGVVLILSSDQLSNVSGFVNAYEFGSQTVFGDAAPFFNHIAALAFVFVLLSSGTTWLMGSDRLMAIGA